VLQLTILMSESRTHLLLKRFAKRQLKREGFRVEEEYPVIVEGKRYRVDVVGIRYSKRVAVECGEVNDPRKYEDLKKLFDEVRVYGLLDVLEFCEKYINEFEEREGELHARIRGLEEKIREVVGRLTDDLRFYERRIQGKGRKDSTLEIRCNRETIEKFKEFRSRIEADSHESCLAFLLWLANQFQFQELKKKFYDIYRRKYPFELV